MRAIRILCAGFMIGVLCAPAAALAQGAYPNRTVRFIVPFLPGPAPDIVGRTVAEELSKRMGQPFIVENRAGAGGTIGAEFVAKSPADGYTIFVATEAPLGISPIVYPKLGYDVLKDFTPISIVARSGFYLVVCPTLPVRGVADLVELSRKRPISYASSGYGSFHHLTAELMKKRGAFQMTHVPYKGASAALADIMGCNVDLGFVAVGSVLPQVKAGLSKLKPIAVTTLRREPETPDIPTLSESGFPGVEMEGYYGLVAPRGTPQTVIDRLAAEVADVMKTKAIIDRYRDLGLTIVAGTPQEFAARLVSDLDRFGKLASEVNLQVQ